MNSMYEEASKETAQRRARVFPTLATVALAASLMLGVVAPAHGHNREAPTQGGQTTEYAVDGNALYEQALAQQNQRSAIAGETIEVAVDGNALYEQALAQQNQRSAIAGETIEVAVDGNALYEQALAQQNQRSAIAGETIEVAVDGNALYEQALAQQNQRSAIIGEAIEGAVDGSALYEQAISQKTPPIAVGENTGLAQGFYVMVPETETKGTMSAVLLQIGSDSSLTAAGALGKDGSIHRMSELEFSGNLVKAEGPREIGAFAAQLRNACVAEGFTWVDYQKTIDQDIRSEPQATPKYVSGGMEY